MICQRQDQSYALTADVAQESLDAIETIEECNISTKGRKVMHLGEASFAWGVIFAHIINHNLAREMSLLALMMTKERSLQLYAACPGLPARPLLQAAFHFPQH